MRSTAPDTPHSVEGPPAPPLSARWAGGQLAVEDGRTITVREVQSPAPDVVIRLRSPEERRQVGEGVGVLLLKGRFRWGVG